MIKREEGTNTISKSNLLMSSERAHHVHKVRKKILHEPAYLTMGRGRGMPESITRHL